MYHLQAGRLLFRITLIYVIRARYPSGKGEVCKNPFDSIVLTALSSVFSSRTALLDPDSLLKSCSDFRCPADLQPLRKSPRRSSLASVCGSFFSCDVQTLSAIANDTTPSCPSPFQTREQPQGASHGCGCHWHRSYSEIMTLKNAALLALIGTTLMTALLLWTFVFTFLNVLRGLVSAAMLFQSFIYAVGCFSVAVFFYVFHRAQ